MVARRFNFTLNKVARSLIRITALNRIEKGLLKGPALKKDAKSIAIQADWSAKSCTSVFSISCMCCHRASPAQAQDADRGVSRAH